MGILTDDDVLPWVESQLGGRIASFTRQAGRESGGRPGWFIRLDAGGAQRGYYVRGDRGGDFGYTAIYGLQREGRILRVLREQGIPVPEVIAACEDPNVLVMEQVEGASDFTRIGSAAERDRIARDFAGIMARWHAIPAERFEAAGCVVPRRREDYLLRDLEVWEQGHFPLLLEPVPLVTFTCAWLRRNLPEPPARPVLVQGDTGPGQFVFRDGRVAAVTDWELAHLGDPMRDLAHVRARDVWYPTGNLMEWFRAYAELSGTPLDVARIRYYSVIAMFTTALALGPVVQRLDPRDEHAEWLAQDVWSKRATAEALADAAGVALEPIALPEPDAPEIARLFDALEHNLEREQLPHVEDGFRQHRMRLLLRLVAHLRNLGTIGREIDALELDDLAELLGKRPSSRREGTRALEAFVRAAGPDLDEPLIRFFHRHAQREEALMRGGMGRAENARTTPLEGL